jgi:hypothetical protein
MSERYSRKADPGDVPEADWEAVWRRLDGLRHHSLDYLGQALS